MAMCRVSGVFTLSVLALGLTTTAQTLPPDERRLRAFENGRRIRMEITLDRLEYLGGESMWADLVAFNPEAEPVEVFDPSSPEAAGMEFHGWHPDQQAWVDTAPDPALSVPINWEAPIRTLGPGERVAQRFLVSYSRCPECGSFASILPPYASGRYEAIYCYILSGIGCGRYEFTVLEPSFQALATVRFAEPYRDRNPNTGYEKTHPRYLQAAILDAGGKRYVVLSRGVSGESDLSLRAPAHYIRNVMAPFDRIAEAAPDAANLRLAADAEENLTVTWTEGGQDRSHCISKDRSRVEACTPSHSSVKSAARLAQDPVPAK